MKDGEKDDPWTVKESQPQWVKNEQNRWEDQQCQWKKWHER